MAVKSVPISAAVLGWAREEAGFTESDLAERVNRPTADIEAWEAGTAQPTQGQFTKLVKVLNRPSAMFFMSEPPTAAAMPTAFRSSSALDGHKLGPDEVKQIRWARRLQGITSWVLRDQGRRPVTLKRYNAEADPVRVADIERNRSGISTADQIAWGSPSEAFRAWRAWLEDNDVLVLQLSMGKNNIRGFGAWDDYAPVVAVNTAYHPTARIFTLFHEVGHLLTRTNSACKSFVRPDRHDVSAERWCERFAAAFLLPDSGIRAEATRYHISAGSPTSDPDKARLIANRFSVSTRATAIRLQEIGLADPGFYEAVVSQFADKDWPTSGGGRGGGQSAPKRRIRQLGRRLVNTLISAADRDRLTTRDLADFLRLKTGPLDDLRGMLDESR